MSVAENATPVNPLPADIPPYFRGHISHHQCRASAFAACRSYSALSFSDSVKPQPQVLCQLAGPVVVVAVLLETLLQLKMFMFPVPVYIYYLIDTRLDGT